MFSTSEPEKPSCAGCETRKTSLMAGTLFHSTRLPLTTWFLAIYLVSQSKNTLSALSFKRQLGLCYRTACRMKHKLMEAMARREDRYTLEGRIEVDDAYLGGEHTGGKRGRGSENKIPFVAAVSTNEDGHPMYAKLSPVSGFTQEALESWGQAFLAPGSTVIRIVWPALPPFLCWLSTSRKKRAAENPRIFPSFTGSTRFWEI